MRARARSGPVRVSATAADSTGALYISGPLTPYDVEALYDQFVGRKTAGDEGLHIYVDLRSVPRNAPELKNLARGLKRLERHGVVVSMHAARSKLTPRG